MSANAIVQYYMYVLVENRLILVFNRAENFYLNNIMYPWYWPCVCQRNITIFCRFNSRNCVSVSLHNRPFPESKCVCFSTKSPFIVCVAHRVCECFSLKTYADFSVAVKKNCARVRDGLA